MTGLGHPTKIAALPWEGHADLKIYVKTNLNERMYKFPKEEEERSITETLIDISAEDKKGVVLLQQHMNVAYAIHGGLGEVARSLTRDNLPEFEKKLEIALTNLRQDLDGGNSNDLEITKINPVFSERTPGFGKFVIITGIKNNAKSNVELIVSCFYVGYTKPGVYYKNEPSIEKQYKVINLKSGEEGQFAFDGDGFRSYHPETLGELIISIAGKSVVKSIPLQTSFHPESED